MINTLLAKVEHGTSTFNRMIGDYAEVYWCMDTKTAC